MGKSIIEIHGMFSKLREDFYSDISNIVSSAFCKENIILTGIKDENVNDSLKKKSTYGIPLSKINEYRCNNDLIDYAQNSVVVYDGNKLSQTKNGDYILDNPSNAVLGFLHLAND